VGLSEKYILLQDCTALNSILSSPHQR